jgi:hypothetical protein
MNIQTNQHNCEQKTKYKTKSEKKVACNFILSQSIILHKKWWTCVVEKQLQKTNHNKNNDNIIVHQPEKKVKSTCIAFLSWSLSLLPCSSV